MMNARTKVISPLILDSKPQNKHHEVEIFENVPSWNRMNGGDRFQNRKFCGTNNPTLMAGTLTFTGRVLLRSLLKSYFEAPSSTNPDRPVKNQFPIGRNRGPCWS